MTAEKNSDQSNTSTLTPDLEEAERFLVEMHRDRSINLVAIEQGRPPKAQSFSPDNREDMRAWISDCNLDEWNIYWHVNTLKANCRDRKAKKSDVAEVVMFHVDVDDPHPLALEKLKDFDPKPSVILFSGGGYQAFWLLDEPMKDLAAAEAINMGLAERLGGDSCHNVDRIMRVPGTINWPNKKKRRAGRVPVLANVL